MAEKIVSPGVFTNEIDQSFLPAAVADIGAAIIGPTVKGPAGIPTVVTSYSDFQNKFGDVFKSGSNSFQFLTSHAAEQYLRHSNTLTVVRIMDGTFSPATTDISSSVVTSGVETARGTFKFDHVPSGSLTGEPDEITIGGVDFTFVSSSAGLANSATQVFVSNAGGSDTTTGIIRTAQSFAHAIGSSSLHGLPISASSLDNQVIVSGSSAGTSANLAVTTGSGGDTTATVNSFVHMPEGESVATLTAFGIGGGSQTTTGGAESFRLTTLADGSIMNNEEDTVRTNHILISGSKHNIRYEVSGVNNAKGTFTLTIRRGDDNIKRKQILESFSGVNLDPNSNAFLGKMIGDQVQTVRTDDDGKPYLQLSGSYPAMSKYVRVSNIETTIDYIDENGTIRVDAASASLPAEGSGSGKGGFKGGSDGFCGFDALGHHNGTKTGANPANFYEDISDTNSQGFDPTEANQGLTGYTEALDLLANQDEFDINLILAPGIISAEHNAVASKIIDVCEDRGDCFAIIDPVKYDKTLTNAKTEANGRDSNYAAVYWPWVKVPDNQLGIQRWVPPSVCLGGIYAFNDKVAHPWFAPAGLNRGGIDTAIQAEKKLTQADRDTLYDNNVNPIATFPGQGVTVFGQKTLQKKSSALDRINVRRLLIRVKKFIASSSRFLVFEQNTAATRRRFLGIVNPFLENVQSQSGLSAFRVVMDETNNTPDTIDRNQLVGQLFLQPTRTAEFIVLDFTIQPTGASFPE